MLTEIEEAVSGSAKPEEPLFFWNKRGGEQRR
jgi:hypothetical protein